MNFLIRVTLWSLAYHLLASLIWSLGFFVGMQHFSSSDNGEIGSVLFFLHALLMLPATIGDFFMQSAGEDFMSQISRGALGPFPSFLTIATSIAAGALATRIKGVKQ